MIDLIKEYIHCEYIDPKEAAEYIFECAEKFVNEKLQNETIDLNYFSGTQVWNMPPTILFKSKIPYSEEWIKNFGRALYNIKKDKLIIRTINGIKWKIQVAQGYDCRLLGNPYKWISGMSNLCVVVNRYIEEKQ